MWERILKPRDFSQFIVGRMNEVCDRILHPGQRLTALKRAMLQVGENCDFLVSKEYWVSYQMPEEYYPPGEAPQDWHEAKIDVTWFKPGETKPYMAIEIDNYPYIKSIAKLRASNASLLIWVYIGDVELDGLDIDGITVLRPKPSDRTNWVPVKKKKKLCKKT